MTGIVFNWLSVLPTALGGVISIVTTVTMFAVSQRVDRHKRSLERRKLECLMAFTGLKKLLNTASAVENLARHFDTNIQMAAKEGRSEMDTALIILPMIGGTWPIERLTADETVFLLEENAQLVMDISEIEQRAVSHSASADSYTLARQEYDDFLLANIEFDKVDGTFVEGTLVGRCGKIAELKLAKLNMVIVPLIDRLDEDRKQVKDVVRQYHSAAKKHFGEDFKFGDLDWRED